MAWSPSPSSFARSLYERTEQGQVVSYHDIRSALERGGFTVLEGRRGRAHDVFRRGAETISVPLLKPVGLRFVEQAIRMLETAPAGDGQHVAGKSAPEAFGASLRAIEQFYQKSAAAADDAVRRGLPPSIWSDLHGIGYSLQELAAIVGRSEHEVVSKEASGDRLDVAEGDRTMRLIRVTGDAFSAFGEVATTLRWMRKPNRALGGLRPIDDIATEHGLGIVRRALGVIAYGGVA